MEYNSLIHAIPQNWKDLLKANHHTLPENINGNKVCLYINNKWLDAADIKCHEAYWTFINKIFISPTCEKKWIEKSNNNLSPEHWEHVHSLTYKITRETKLQSFQLKIIHRIFPCKYNLFRWSVKDSETCDYCNTGCQDNIEHYFFYCNHCTNFWESFRNWWTNVSNIDMRLSVNDIIFGVLNYNNDNLISILNYVILLAKWFIYHSKLDNKYALPFHQFQQTVKSHLDVEKFIMYKNGHTVDFHQRWDTLLNNL